MENKKVLFDLSGTQPDIGAKFHGGSEYTKFFYRAALDAGFEFDICYNINFPLHDDINDSLSNINGNIYKFSSKNDLYKLILKNGYDNFFAGLPYKYFDINCDNVKKIFTIHGLRQLEFFSYKERIPYEEKLLKKIAFYIREYSSKNRILKRMKEDIKRLIFLSNSQIITVSSHSLYSIKSYFPDMDLSMVKVCHPPMSFKLLNQLKPQEQGKYFLLVSGDRWIKNNFRAIEAFDKLYSQGLIKDSKVVVLGCEKYNFSKKIVNKEHFVFKGYLPEEELQAYVKYACAFVYPSLNEGFGYPPVNAMIYGTPVIASAAASIPEVCQNAALYFTPFSIEEMKNRILQIYFNEGLRKKLIQNGFERVNTLAKQQEEMVKETLDTIFY